MKIKRLMTMLYRFLNSQKTSKYIVNIILCFLILLIISIFNREIMSDVLGVFLGFIISSLVVGLIQVLLRSFEDNAKVTDDTEMLAKIYKGDLDIRKTLTLGETSVDFVYKEVFASHGEEIVVEDTPQKRYEPDGFIADNFNTLFGAHRMSVKKNFDTVRVDDFCERDGKFVLSLSRSKYYYHLVTNRAVDYPIDDDLSLRTYYEYGPKMKSLSESVMSNHIGINALVFLKDGELLLPRRNATSTISKNLVTSGIAIMLAAPKDDGVVDYDYMFKKSIMDGLCERTKMREEWVTKDSVEIEFLGFGQNPYEAGKPQFYFAVHMKNLARQEYIENLFRVQREKKKNKHEIDIDKYIYVAKPDEMKFDKNENLVLSVYHGWIAKKGYREREEKHSVGYEKSFLANLWQYEKYKRENGSRL